MVYLGKLQEEDYGDEKHKRVDKPSFKKKKKHKMVDTSV